MPTKAVAVGDVSLNALVATTEREHRQGLSGVESLPPATDGMLFVYESPSRVTFSMLETNFALDIWFFDPQGDLVGSASMETCVEPCTRFRSPQAVLWVLETPQGRYDFEPGSTISFGS